MLHLINFKIHFKKISEPRNSSAAATRGRLTERLLAQGLLTPAMLTELRKEWDQQIMVPNSNKHSNDDLSKKLRRKRKPK